jgi:hypothetical protein
MIVLVLIVLVGLRIWFWSPAAFPFIAFLVVAGVMVSHGSLLVPMNPAAFAATAAAFLWLVDLVRRFDVRHHPTRIEANVFRGLFAGSSLLSRWQLRIVLAIESFLVASLFTLGQSCLWFDRRLREKGHRLIHLLTILPRAPRKLYGRFTSPKTY